MFYSWLLASAPIKKENMYSEQEFKLMSIQDITTEFKKNKIFQVSITDTKKVVLEIATSEYLLDGEKRTATYLALAFLELNPIKGEDESESYYPLKSKCFPSVKVDQAVYALTQMMTSINQSIRGTDPDEWTMDDIYRLSIGDVEVTRHFGVSNTPTFRTKK